MRTLTLTIYLSSVIVATAQDHQHGDAGQLGTVQFANSCAAPVQPDFAHAMALLHSFEFVPARQAFTGVVEKDPTCGIALWGIALTHWANPFAAGIKTPGQIEAGRATVERGRAAGARTPRERAYIDAAAKLFERADTLDQRTRLIAYRDAMAQVSSSYPEDPEAAAFHALALAAAADPGDKSYADLLKAGAILERLWVKQPLHPGLAHYIIHSYDVPALAPKALEAARRYGKIAPAAPHALHMPSHTFTRLGYWQESIDTNILSAEAARKTGNTGEELHALDYQAYAYLQLGQEEPVRRIVESLPSIAARFDPAAPGSAASGAAGLFAIAAIPARYTLERGAWRDAAGLEVRPSRSLHVTAITLFARAVGAARANDPALLVVATEAIDRLGEIADRLKGSGEAYWAEQVSIQRLGASAWLALAKGNRDQALAMMREAADREDRTEKNAVTPGPLAPAREMLGEMLLELNQPAEAAAAFKATMDKEPNRLRARVASQRAAR